MQHICVHTLAYINIYLYLCTLFKKSRTNIITLKNNHMKQNFVISLALLLATTLSAAQYCGETITGTKLSHKATITCQSLGGDQYRFVFTSEEAFTSYNVGSNFYANINGVGGFQVSQNLKQSGNTLTCDMTSNQAPTFYVGDFFVLYSDGEEWYKIPIDCDFTATCGDSGTSGDSGDSGNSGTSGDSDTPGDSGTPGPTPGPNPGAEGTCTGHITNVDAFYSNADKEHAIQSLTNGADWTVKSADNGSVEVKMTFLDAIEGMAAPYLFTFDDKGVLIGDPIQMSGWDPATRTASHTVTGKAAGSEFVFLVQVACGGGKVLFSERVLYVVGTDCSAEGEDQQNLPTCSGDSKAVDDYYTKNSAAASGADVFTNGYTWMCQTQENNDVKIEVSFLDFFPGMAAPQLFLFHNVGGNEVLNGDPIPMNWLGTKALYTLKNQTPDTQLRFLVQIAYELHILFTERITYTVGQNCEGQNPDPEGDKEAVESVNANIAPATKVLINGQLLLYRNGTYYTTTGQTL